MQYNEIEFGNDENRITITLLEETMGKGLMGMLSSTIFKENIALIAKELSFYHPITKELLIFNIDLPKKYPYNLF